MKWPLVSIIIPVFNREGTVGRAIKSAFAQTYPSVEVIVVNDGSSDNSETVIQSSLDECVKRTGNRGVYLEQANQGVAIARNKGFFEAARGELIMCLDADDAIGTRYLELLVPKIWENRDIGVVYTSLLNVNPDGARKVSTWPGKFDAAAHFEGAFNQVPTAALARREVWERLNGQRQRYAPRGAGAEDGDFWLRAATYGFRIEYVSPKYGHDGMFHYTTGQGLVSGNRSYSEIPWRTWSPWYNRPDLMPTASIAPARRFSHPARIYQEPTVSVIIPVGPGHAKYLVDSLDSLDAQTLKKWEAIVVFDIPDDEWECLRDSGELDRISTGWPWARFTSTHARGKFARELTDTLDVAVGQASLLASLPAGEPRGAGAARNIGIRASRAPLLIFLDADDYFLPTALEKMVIAYKREKKIIFAEHYGIAPIKKEDLHLALGEVTFYNDINGLAVIKQGTKDYNCKEAAEQPYTDGRVPYIICNVSSLIPRKWALELGGFPEDLPSWEDVLFWWRASWEGRCFFKISEPLLAYRYYTGLRRERGREIARDLLLEIAKRKEGVEIMGCRCGDAPGAGVVIDAHGARVETQGDNMATLRLSRGSQLAVDDADLQYVQFLPPDMGDKLRFGQHDFGGGNFVNYGRLAGGEKIFVHVSDIQADLNIARAQGRDPIYRPIVEEIVVDEPIEDLGEPELVTEEEAEEEIFQPADAENVGVETDEYFPAPVEGSYPRRLTPVHDMDTGDLRNPGRYADILEENGIRNAFDIVKFNKENAEGLGKIDGIGPKAASVFTEAADALV